MRQPHFTRVQTPSQIARLLAQASWVAVGVSSLPAHALGGELHRLLMIGGGVVAAAAAGSGLGRCFLPACGDCVDTGSMPSVLVTAASLDRA
jgi:hypothetical protein